MKLALALVLAASPAFADTGERGAGFVALLRQNDCGMTEAEAETLLGAAGYTADETQGFAGALLAGGLAEMSEDGQRFRLTKSFCAADPAQDAAIFANVDPGAVALDRVKTLGMPGVRASVALFVMERRCAIELDGARDVRPDIADTILARAGIDAPKGSPARGELDRMIAEVLRNPGKAYTVKDGWMTMNTCTPKG